MASVLSMARVHDLCSCILETRSVTAVCFYDAVRPHPEGRTHYELPSHQKAYSGAVARTGPARPGAQSVRAKPKIFWHLAIRRATSSGREADCVGAKVDPLFGKAWCQGVQPLINEEFGAHRVSCSCSRANWPSNERTVEPEPMVRSRHLGNHSSSRSTDHSHSIVRSLSEPYRF